jgi:hypothetical protein
MKKLTYYQICKLIQQGRENEIPSGYNIVWTTPKPQKLFDVEIPGEMITVNGNDFPVPTKAYVSGKYEIIIPGDIISTDKILDFGDVFLRANFVLSKLKFEYEYQYDIMHWMNAKFIYGEAIKKSDYVFNATLIIGDTTLTKINVFNAWPNMLDDNSVDIVYDWVELISD